MKKGVHSYQVALVPDEDGGYTVLVPALPGCISFGATVDEAIENAREAIELHLENLKAHRLELGEESRRPVLNTVVDVTY
ncbi:MAG TPA: type II toxin-antitoxin system HicB family antitoxin [Candidatus Binataceae bacterium]|nr:type II toxin-antitoxin system HicB family antitoxin [Candidatus Binataceae bacterium]